MTTPKQIAANRANAKSSTGPKTPEGKARSRYNALTHGILAQAVIPPPLEAYESRRDYEALLQDLHSDLAPATPVEEMLVETVAASHWRLARLYRVEAALIARRLDTARRAHALGTPQPDSAIAILRDALDDPDALRRLLARPGSRRDDYTDAQLHEFAQGTITALERKYQEALARWRTIAPDESSLPHPSALDRLARYEAQLNRHLFRALRTLRDLQTQRLKGRRPAPPTQDPPASPGPPSP